jgi:phospholipid/cholesterol/gamma-HCH transport system ATP-binding protein
MTAQSQVESVYSLSQVSAGYGGELVLDRISWDLPAGSFFSVLGPSGAGKTLFLKVLAGLISPIRGSVLVHGKPLAGLSRAELRAFRAKLGMTFQKDGLFDSLTCFENLLFPLRERGVSSAIAAKKVDKALDEVGLKGQGPLRVFEMSGGMQKRLGIARALLSSPEVILYDEPTAGLDPVTARSIYQLILDMKSLHEMSVVMVTSDVRAAYLCSSRIGLLWKGRFEMTGSVAEVRASKNPAVNQFFHARLQGPLTENFDV